jgi:hypothetical protein
MNTPQEPVLPLFDQPPYKPPANSDAPVLMEPYTVTATRPGLLETLLHYLPRAALAAAALFVLVKLIATPARRHSRRR